MTGNSLLCVAVSMVCSVSVVAVAVTAGVLCGLWQHRVNECLSAFCFTDVVLEISIPGTDTHILISIDV